MPDRPFDTVLAELRRRVGADERFPENGETAQLSRALHELDVYHAELEIQNQDLRQTQLQLSRARDKYRALFDESMIPFLSVSDAGILLDANRAAFTLLDRDRERLIGKPLIICLAEGEAQAYFRHIHTVVETTQQQSVELSLKAREGVLRKVILRTQLIASEEPKTLLCNLTDVTEQREIEHRKEQLENRVREAEKLEAIGRVAANIAHDVNNILVSVISIGEFAKSETSDGTTLSKDLDSLLDAAWRGARLMRGLLGLSRGAVRPAQAIDVTDLLTRVAGLLRHKKSTVRVELEISEKPIWVMGDEDELLQAVLNVATNGLESMRQGVLRLSASARTTGPNRIARIQIQDAGIGMDEATLARVFEPLFTTKASSGGSGLGLTLVHKTISALGGTIDIDSTKGEGTTVTLDLISRHAVTNPAPPRLEPKADPLPINVLLVDDDDQVRRSTSRQLASVGARVSAFADGPSALEAVTDRHQFDVCVIDINMPVWTGPELVNRLISAIGSIPIVFITGASGELIPDALRSLNHVTLVRKPWARRELVDAIRSVLHEFRAT
jgi:PAS domain S-box-containing protein